MNYVVVYRNHPNFKGMDLYIEIADGVRTTSRKEFATQLTETLAKAMAEKHRKPPDDAHLPAEIWPA